MAPDIIERWKIKRQHSISFIYRSLPFRPTHARSESINADSLNSNFLQLGRRSGGRPQRTVHPMRLPVSTVIHTTLEGLEPTTFRLLVRRATSSATNSPLYFIVNLHHHYLPLPQAFPLLAALLTSSLTKYQNFVSLSPVILLLHSFPHSPSPPTEPSNFSSFTPASDLKYLRFSSTVLTNSLTLIRFLLPGFLRYALLSLHLL